MSGTGSDEVGSPVAAGSLPLPGPILHGSSRIDDGTDFEELAEIATKGVHDPVEALRAIIEIATRSLDRRSRRKPAGEEARAANDPQTLPAAVDQGGSMPPNIPILATDPRPFTGYERARETYRRSKAELLKHDEGRYVVIVGDEMLGPFETDRLAERAGYTKFGLGPLYIRRILAEEPIAAISRFLAP